MATLPDAAYIGDAVSAFESIFPPGPLPPLVHNTTSLQQAMRDGTLGVGYAGSG
jgi:hypothetical protein